jgi:hypothetical protein
VRSAAGLAVRQGPSASADRPAIRLYRPPAVGYSDVCLDASGRCPSDVIFPKDVQSDNPAQLMALGMLTATAGTGSGIFII